MSISGNALATYLVAKTIDLAKVTYEFTVAHSSEAQSTMVMKS